jgi:DNA polymerase-3 subunit gamma/tau
MWPDVLERLKTLKRTTWSTASQYAQVVDVSDGVLRLGFSNAGALGMFSRGAHADLVRQALIDVLGLDVRVEPALLDGGRAAASSPPAARPTAPSPPPASSRPAPAAPAARSAETADEADDVPPPPEPPAEDDGPAPERRPHVAPEHDTPSHDDPDAEDSHMVGARVVEQMLGGRVIDSEGS